MLYSCKETNQSSRIGNLAIRKKATPPIETPTIEARKVKISQSPLHKSLSKRFNYQSFIERIPTDYVDSCLITIEVSSKDNQAVLYEANITSNYLLGDSTFIHDNVRSYLTASHVNREVVDNDSGDIVVADFNFDDLEDFAIKIEEGGNGGPLYNFYIQSDPSLFVIDTYLSDSMMWFPNKIDKNRKCLQTLVRANSVSVCETSYKYNSTNRTWKEVKKQFYDN